MTQAALDVAQTHAAGRLVSCLEGGYNVDVLAEAVQAHLEALLLEAPDAETGRLRWSEPKESRPPVRRPGLSFTASRSSGFKRSCRRRMKR